MDTTGESHVVTATTLIPNEDRLSASQAMTESSSGPDLVLKTSVQDRVDDNVKCSRQLINFINMTSPISSQIAKLQPLTSRRIWAG